MENKILADYRSDTVTKPTPGMLEAMRNAPVGDDVYGEDPSVNALEEYAAGLFGMEAALFCPSGTMTNQIAIKVHTQPGDEVICDRMAHIYNYEGGGIAFNSGASVRLLDGERGRFTTAMVAENINDRNNPHFPLSTLVAVENTVNKGGGAIYDIKSLAEISKFCRDNKIAIHLDGARLFNALVATGQRPEEHGRLFDTISICLSKGLGAPVGSLLLGSKEHMWKARRYRKVMGGGMRQAGFLAAAGMYALQNQVARLAEDHTKAKAIEEALKAYIWVEEILTVETNIVVFQLPDSIPSNAFATKMAEQGILLSSFGKQMIRLVTHLDISGAGLDATLDAFKKLEF